VGEEWGSSTHEMSVYDLMLEQATEEQVLVARRHMAIPLDLLERVYPIWVAEPTDDEQKRMPARARDSMPASTAVPPGRGLLRRGAPARPRDGPPPPPAAEGRLALLPCPVEQLEAEAEKRGEPAIKRWWRRVFDGGR